MSRRVPNPAADRAAQNQQTIKSLLKLEGNKSCADCKRNKHPRWASWNLGIFVCIRCSGIHRGMGTHISRVKSVDLDAWTDEQLQSVLQWGNSRANKYWEAKLAPGHVPSEAKLENFIRTKYEAKRWVMDGGIPDPATLDAEGDDDVPLNVVQEKAKLDRSSSQRLASSNQPAPPSNRPVPNVDLFGDNPPSAPARPNTTTPSVSGPSTGKPNPPPPKSSKPGDSLLGLDFFGSSQTSPPARPSSATSVPAAAAASSRPDLKQSILSLYASAPRQASQSQIPQAQSNAYTGMQSPPIQQQSQPNFFGDMQSPPIQQQTQSSSSGLSDAFGSLSFASPTPPQQQQQPPKPSPFSNLANFSSQRSTIAPAQVTSPSTNIGGGGGGFFNTNPKPAPVTKPPPQQSAQAKRTLSSSSGFGDLSSATGGSPLTPKAAQPSSAGLGDLFSMSESSSPPPTPPKPPRMQNTNSAFNLSAPAPPSQHKPLPTTSTQSNAFSSVSSGWSNTDAWGSNDVWSTPDAPPPAPKVPVNKPPPAVTSSPNDFGWGSTGSTSKAAGTSTGSGGGSGLPNVPKVSADEDFGDWGSAPVAAAKPASSLSTGKPAGGFSTSEDLFSNVWE